MTLNTSSEPITSLNAALIYFASIKTPSMNVNSITEAEWIAFSSKKLTNKDTIVANINTLEQTYTASTTPSITGSAAYTVADIAIVGSLYSIISTNQLTYPIPNATKLSTVYNDIINHNAWKIATKSMSKPSVVTANPTPATTSSTAKVTGEKRTASSTESSSNASAKPTTTTTTTEPAAKDKPAKGGKTGGNSSFADAMSALSTYTTSYPVDPTSKDQMTMSITYELERIFTQAIRTAFPQTVVLGVDKGDIEVNPQIGRFVHHYQCNSCLSLFAKLKPSVPKEKKPKAGEASNVAAPAPAPAPEPVALPPGPIPASPIACAQAVADAVNAAGPHLIIGKVEVSPPGYINIYIAYNYLTARLAYTLSNGALARPPNNEAPRKVVIDYSSPNIAKDMHIGHLRSTIIGDALARILEYCGHEIVRLNHVGDWGTQFGMLIAYIKDILAKGEVKDEDLDRNMSELTGFYKAAKKRFDEDAEFKHKSHLEVVALQAGDPTNLALWNRMVNVSSNMFNIVYKLLGIDSRLKLFGESQYNAMLPSVVQELQDKKLTEVSDGAIIIRVPGFEVPLMVRKSDGGFGYDSTDLASLKYRIQELKGTWLIYVVDGGQGLHFDLVFHGGQMAGWYKPDEIRVEHSGFGIVQGEDKKKFKTRSGETVRLIDVLDEARNRALAIIEERCSAGQCPLSTPEEKMHAAEVLGYGGMKYFDLRQNRLFDYVFSYDRMLSPDGDTAVYIQYSHARLISILRKARESNIPNIEDILKGKIQNQSDLVSLYTFTHASELILAADLLRFQDTMNDVQQGLYPHRLCEYLYKLAVRFNDFHRDCYVLKDDVPKNIRDSRLRLLSATAITMQTSLRLIGIEPLERL